MLVPGGITRMKVLVTGGTGFIGRRLVKAILERGTLAGPDGSETEVDRIVVADVADFVIEYTGGAGSLLTSEYVHHTPRLAEAEAGQRGALLNTLLDGYDEADRTGNKCSRRSANTHSRVQLGFRCVVDAVIIAFNYCILR